MAMKMTKRGQQDNEVTYEFMCDNLTDLSAIESKYITLGSIAVVLEGESGFEVYMANSQKQWINLSGGTSAEQGGES